MESRVTSGCASLVVNCGVLHERSFHPIRQKGYHGSVHPAEKGVSVGDMRALGIKYCSSNRTKLGWLHSVASPIVGARG